jgi:hypothetical protein
VGWITAAILAIALIVLVWFTQWRDKKINPVRERPAPIVNPVQQSQAGPAAQPAQDPGTESAEQPPSSQPPKEAPE